MLHNNVENFMKELKTLPKEGPHRGLFVTSHMNSAPFLTALKAHPQGPQVHSMLTNYLNSPKNAGVTPGATKVMAKAEKKEPKERKVDMPLWKDKQIADPSHEHDLEQRAALLEFNDKLPKEEAEGKAHAEYKREQHLKAAAKHWSGMKAAKATGDHEEAKKHQTMYTMHLQELGHDPMGPVPKEVEHHMANAKSEPFYSFSAHPADGYLFNDGKKDKKLKKALPKTPAENDNNYMGFLNHPEAMDQVLENTGANVKQHNVNSQAAQLANTNFRDSWYGTTANHQNSPFDTPEFKEAASDAHLNNYNNGQLHDQNIRQPSKKNLNPANGLEPHNQAQFLAPKEEQMGLAGDKHQEGRYWGSIKTSLHNIRMAASGKKMLPEKPKK